MTEDRASYLSRPDAAGAVREIGWRYLLGALVTSVPVASLAEAVGLAAVVRDACGDDADGHLRLDLRADRLELLLQNLSAPPVTQLDVALARRISEALAAHGRSTDATARPGRRAVQSLELAIDALDIPSIRPFWRAVLGYVDEPGRTELDQGLVDPAGQGPSIWFQQMDEPRPQRNRIHFDVTVPEDEAEARIRVALEAGGTLVSDREAKAFWILADAEGNEVCICTWQDRD